MIPCLNRVWQYVEVFLLPYPPLRRNADTLRLQGQQPYEVGFGCPDVYAKWKQQAIQLNETYSRLCRGKWITQQWRTEQLFASSARAQAYVIDALWNWIQLGHDSDPSNEDVTAILTSLGDELEVYSDTDSCP